MNLGRKFAAGLHEKLNMGSPPFNPFLACKKLDIPVQEKPLKGCLGLTVFYGDQKMVAISSSIREDGRKNFTVAHELAHILIPSHHENGISERKCSRFNIWEKDSVDPKEIEANEFVLDCAPEVGEFLGIN